LSYHYTYIQEYDGPLIFDISQRKKFETTLIAELAGAVSPADFHYEPPVSARWLVESASLAVVMGTLGLYPHNSPTATINCCDILNVVRVGCSN
jgi:hypothetical protein